MIQPKNHQKAHAPLKIHPLNKPKSTRGMQKRSAYKNEWHFFTTQIFTQLTIFMKLIVRSSSTRRRYTRLLALSSSISR